MYDHTPCICIRMIASVFALSFELFRFGITSVKTPLCTIAIVNNSSDRSIITSIPKASASITKLNNIAGLDRDHLIASAIQTLGAQHRHEPVLRHPCSYQAQVPVQVQALVLPAQASETQLQASAP